MTRIQEDLQENNKKMDIQGYIIDHWLGKMSAERSVLVIYDPDWLSLLYKKQKALQVLNLQGFCASRWA